jgi:hypothetical protein
MHPPKTWREVLGDLITSNQERQRLAGILGVNPVTLTRWAAGESYPRQHSLGQLLDLLPPQHREAFLASIADEFPSFSPTLVLDAPIQTEIPSLFYASVLRTVTSIPANLRFESMCDLVLQQVLKHLDPNRVGVACCMPPSRENEIQSLRECVGRGTPPWREKMEQDLMLLGAESLAGYALSLGRTVAIADLESGLSMFPASRGAWGKSAVAAPLLHLGKVAGCLIVESAQVDYFPPGRQTLIENYANLLISAFSDEDFYEPQRIRLQVLPSQTVQRSFLSGFRERFMNNLKRSASQGVSLTVTQAEQIAWQQVEEELLQYMTNTAVRTTVATPP